MRGCCTLHVHSNHTPRRCHRSPAKQCGNVRCLLGCRSHLLPNLECCTVPYDYLHKPRWCYHIAATDLFLGLALCSDLPYSTFWLVGSCLVCVMVVAICPICSVRFVVASCFDVACFAFCCCDLLRFALLCFLFVAICLFWVLVVAICLEPALNAMYIKVMHCIGRNQCESRRYQVDKGNADQCKSIQHKGMHSNAMVAREVS